MAGLSDIDQQMLEFEKRSGITLVPKIGYFRYIWDDATRYYQKLARLILTEQAYAHDPMLVERLLQSRSTMHRAEGMAS